LGGSSCLLLSAGAASSFEIVAALATCHAQEDEAEEEVELPSHPRQLPR